MAAQVEPSVADLAVESELVLLGLAVPDEVEDRVPAGDQQISDQPPMAPPPERLGAHETRCRLLERAIESLLPGVGRHPRRIAPEGGGVDAGEPLLAELAASPSAELDLVAIRDPGRAERRGEPRLVELWMPP